MNIRAAVMEQAHRPLVVADLELDEPRRDEVLVRMLATGICRSDLSYMDGKWPTPLPIVLGHEGAGVIEAVGEGVDPGPGRRARRAHVCAALRSLPLLPGRPCQPLP